MRATDYLEENGTAYLVMDYVDGVSLQKYLEQHGNRMSETKALQLMQPVMDGLRAVHNAGFLHRDVKPSNIYLTESGQVILLDFGSARQSMGAGTHTLTVVLTPGYAAPEQYSSRGVQGPWTDVYSCAATLYRCITGHLPPEAQDRLSPDDPALLMPPSGYPDAEVSRHVDFALVRALELDRTRRPQSIDEFHKMFHGGDGLKKDDTTKIKSIRNQQHSKRPRFWKKIATAVFIMVWFVLCSGMTLLFLLFLGFMFESSIEETDQPYGLEPATPQEFRTKTKEYVPLTDSQVEQAKLDNWKKGKPVNPEAGTVWAWEIADNVTLELVWIPPGRFLMGSPGSEEDRDDDETQHQVTIIWGFWLGKYEVTQAQWEKVMGNNPSEFKGNKNLPVESVSWEDCQEFIKRLNAHGEGMFRLPTEAEWEYACRAGSTTAYSFGDASSELYRYANYCDRANSNNLPWQDTAHNDGYDKTAPVGSFKPNPWGLYDMHGNVWEWCQDPIGPDSGSLRVRRGGCWFNCEPVNCRSALRYRGEPGYRVDLLGFRLVASPAGE
ncbi:MAG: Serine/threonine-protein kinase pkn1 [Candidatus Hydrogenedentes bacterium ADurb.Bin179]|nr:MAG: Serine/threonine-protein kinase pkn1 [Candidatus Hydrogenedentes bacterium ADurb.Bin179]